MQQTQRTADTTPAPLSYGVRDAAKATGISEKLLRNMIKAGKVPIVRLEGRIVIRHATLDALLARLEQQHATE